MTAGTAVGLPAELVIVGDGESAEIACEYFGHDSPHRPVAFAVERAYLQRDELLGLPVVAFEEVERAFPPERFAAFVAISSTRLNRVRARLYRAAKAKGYRLATYVSSRAFVWRNVTIGDNCFVFEHNVLQHHVQVGNDVVLWSGNHVGHRSRIHDHVFVSSHAVISGFCEIGESSFLGVNCALANNIVVGKDCVIGMGAVVVRSTEPGRAYVGNPARPMDKDAYAAFAVPEEER